MTTHPEFHVPTKKTRTTDIVREAVNRGRPLPLQVMLEAMWGLRDEAKRLAALPPSDRGYSPQRLRAALLASVAVAEKAAPYVHPKLQNVAIRPEDDEEAQARRASQETVKRALAGASIDDLSRIWMSLAKGDEGELAEALGAQPEGSNGQADGPRQLEPPDDEAEEDQGS